MSSNVSTLKIDIEQIYDLLSSIDVKLENIEEPDSQYIGQKTVECRAALKQVQDLTLKMNREKTRVATELSNLETQFDISRDRKLAHDANVRAGSSIEDRNALINVDLVDMKREIHVLKNDMETLKNLEKVLNLFNKNLNSINADIKQQAKIMESQMRELNMGSKQDKAVSELQRGFAAVRKLEKGLTEVDGVTEGEDDIEIDDDESEENLDIASEMGIDGDVDELDLDGTKFDSGEEVAEDSAESEDLDDILSGIPGAISKSVPAPKKETPQMDEGLDGGVEDGELDIDAIASIPDQPDSENAVDYEDDDEDPLSLLLEDDEEILANDPVEGSSEETETLETETESEPETEKEAQQAETESEEVGIDVEIDIDLDDIDSQVEGVTSSEVEESPSDVPSEAKPKKSAASAVPSKKDPAVVEGPKADDGDMDDIDALLAELD